MFEKLIYYINHEKASEISMLFDNEIVEKITRIKNTEFVIAGDADVTTGATAKLPVIGQYLPSLDLNGNLVKIKDVYLTVVNSDDVMATKALMSDLVSRVPVEGSAI